VTLTPELQKAREESLAAECTWCHAAIGAVCTGENGQPLAHWPAHEVRLRDAGVKLRPVRAEEVAGNPIIKNRDEQLRRGRIEYERRKVEMQNRRRELIADARAGQLDERARAEMLDLDRTLGLTPDEPAVPEQRDTPADTAPWMRGPGRTREGHR
jgi:hypothetical protein